MANRLKNKVAFITGAGAGMGREAAVLFAEEGARVVVADIDAAAAGDTVKKIEAAGGQALAVAGDVAIEADVQRMIADGVRRFGGLHVLYNNAGVLWKDRDRSVLDTDEKWWDRVMAINLKSVFWVTKHGIPHLKTARAGSIIMMGSVSALAGFTRAQDAYTAAKGALISLTKSLAKEVATSGVRVNCVSPALIDTPMTAPGSIPSAHREASIARVPLGRPGQPEEVASVIAFLCSDEASFVTGQCYDVSGGRSVY